MNNSTHVAVIGAGVIGLCWAALFAAKGYEVQVYDPRDDLDDQLTHTLPLYLKQIPDLPQDVNSILSRVHACHDLKKATMDAKYIQESGPESVTFKQALWAEIEQYVSADCLLLSSSSGIVASTQGAKMNNSHRIVIGHPFNPPHILPLVEICAAKTTSPQLIQQATEFYQSLGKFPVALNHEKSGFVANRLQMALVLEAIKLVNEGVVGIKELDDIVTHSLGIRWASVGPLLAFHLGGGAGGLTHLLEHIGVGLANAIGQPDMLTNDLISAIGKQANNAYPKRDLQHYCDERDRRQQVIINDQNSH
ncbi:MULTISPECIES: 3-hydroxyacyl-CoA dehydrogenase NAD-binding domain-containing protein [Vibrio]|nr:MULTISPECIES: 3-hydroxyacyl-CoA dehydrogenase NAD-binding domain-containing protein [Vibrio]MBF9000136.1 NAD-binding protein [Vibrio nitrifigilis]